MYTDYGMITICHPSPYNAKSIHNIPRADVIEKFYF